MTWPDGSWLFSKHLGDESTRLFAAVMLALAALGYFVAGSALLFRQEWWHPTVIASALFSTLVFFLLWDGKFQALDDKGVVGTFINMVILALVVFLKRNV
jgi:CHASE2 domain-containing sensor protein